MITKMAITLVIGAVMTLSTSTAQADTWTLPPEKQVMSADGNWRLTIYPREIEGRGEYFRDKVDGREPAGSIAGSRQTSAVGQLERKREGRWHTAWKRPIANEVSPVDAVVSNAGVAVTFDNWHSMGYGNDVVVIYAADGRLVRAFGLSEFLPDYYIAGLQHTVSSIWWRGDGKVDEARGQLVIPVAVPVVRKPGAIHERGARHVQIRFELADGALVPTSGTDWQDAIASARSLNAARLDARAESHRKFLAPLAAPTATDSGDWYDYVRDAFRRLHGETDAYPVVTVIPARNTRDFARQARSLGDTLSKEGSDLIAIASPFQDALVTALRAQAVRAKPASLKQALVYVASDDAHMPAILAALAHTQAKVVQIDIAKPIPQRRSEIERVRREADAER